MADDDGYASEGSSPRSHATSPYAKKSSATNSTDLPFLDLDTFFKRSMRSGAAKVFARRPSLRRSVFDEQLESADLLFARHLRSKRETFIRSPSCGALLPTWPAVDDDHVTDLISQLTIFELDPTTLSTDVLCHLAMAMFVRVGLPAGLAEEKVRLLLDSRYRS